MRLSHKSFIARNNRPNAAKSIRPHNRAKRIPRSAAAKRQRKPATASDHTCPPRPLGCILRCPIALHQCLQLPQCLIGPSRRTAGAWKNDGCSSDPLTATNAPTVALVAAPSRAGAATGISIAFPVRPWGQWTSVINHLHVVSGPTALMHFVVLLSESA